MINCHKIALISDIHANYQALEAVISHADQQGVHDVWFLGDAVNYGPDPYRCLKLLKKTVTNHHAWVLGNHDEAMKYPPDKEETLTPQHLNLRTQLKPLTQAIGTNKDTLIAFRINYEILEAFADLRDFLLAHDTTSQIDRHFFLFHGGLRSGTPTTTYTYDRIHVQDEFLIPVYKITNRTLKKLKLEELPRDIYKKLKGIKNQEIIGEDRFIDRLKHTIENQHTSKYRSMILDYAFFDIKPRFPDPGLKFFLFGHTHQPACFKGVISPERVEFISHDMEPGREIPLEDNHVWYLNPGSVGQPRDRDWRASYMVFDSARHTLRLHRVEYNIRATQKQMATYHMPVNLISRLSSGQ
jgi:predicted phosphodiesterase